MCFILLIKLINLFINTLSKLFYKLLHFYHLTSPLKMEMQPTITHRPCCVPVIILLRGKNTGPLMLANRISMNDVTVETNMVCVTLVVTYTQV